MFKDLSAAFTGGVVGALASVLVHWLLNHVGLLSMLGISMVPKLTLEWMYPKLVWGGIWGLLFILPVLKSKVVPRGLLLSLVPTFVAFIVILPDLGKGYLGLKMGQWTPLLVGVLNAVWGMIGAFWYRQTR